MDGATEATTEGDLPSKLSSLLQEEILGQTLSEPKTVGLLSGRDRHRQRSSLHLQGVLLQGLCQPGRQLPQSVLHDVAS